VIGERCFKEILDLDGNVARMQYSNNNNNNGALPTPDKNTLPQTPQPLTTRRIERDPSMENLALSLADQFSRTTSASGAVPMSWVGGSLLADSANLGTSFAPNQMAGPAAPTSPAGVLTTPTGASAKRTGEVKQRFWSSRYFPEYLDLTMVRPFLSFWPIMTDWLVFPVPCRGWRRTSTPTTKDFIGLSHCWSGNFYTDTHVLPTSSRCPTPSQTLRSYQRPSSRTSPFPLYFLCKNSF